mgnify:CR=1 FL=1
MLDTFGISPDHLSHYLAAVGARYHANPYHNFNHGVHVLLASWLLVHEEQLIKAREQQKRIAEVEWDVGRHVRAQAALHLIE